MGLKEHGHHELRWLRLDPLTGGPKSASRPPLQQNVERLGDMNREAPYVQQDGTGRENEKIMGATLWSALACPQSS